MARYVVLSIEDNVEAEDFVQRTEFDVVGIYAQPTVFCQGGLSTGCSKWRGKLGGGPFWLRGTKYGWMVCKVCQKPARPMNAENLLRNVLIQGVNLLNGIGGRQTGPFDAGWGSYRNHDVPDSWRKNRVWNKELQRDDFPDEAQEQPSTQPS